MPEHKIVAVVKGEIISVEWCLAVVVEPVECVDIFFLVFSSIFLVDRSSSAGSGAASRPANTTSTLPLPGEPLHHPNQTLSPVPKTCYEYILCFSSLMKTSPPCPALVPPRPYCSENIAPLYTVFLSLICKKLWNVKPLNELSLHFMFEEPALLPSDVFSSVLCN